MSGASELLLRIASLGTLAAITVSAAWAWRARDRWGGVPRPLAMVGTGPYRRAPAHSWAPRRVPPRVLVVAGLGIAWGTLTTLLFAPSGLVFLLAPARHEPGRQMLLVLAGLGVFATAIAGLALGPTLVRASRALLERAADAEDRAITAATWSALHHAMVLLSFVLFAVHERDPSFAVMVALPCALGLVHAWSLAHVARYVGRLRDTSEETSITGESARSAL